MADATECAGCGAAIPARESARGLPRKWCSEACRLSHFRAANPAYMRRQSRRAAEKHAARMAAQGGPRAPQHDLTCCVCGETFRAVRRDRRYCSKPCRNKALRLARRARHAAAPRERYDLADIFERDGWRCQLCGRTVRRELKYPHPLSASIDHVVPFAHGGADVAANVQLAHLRCNLAKGARVFGAGEQLRLVS